MGSPVHFLGTDGIEFIPVSEDNPLPVTGGGGGGGGGAVTVANGADVAQGSTADAAYTTGAGTIVSILKGVFGRLGVVFGENGTAVASQTNPIPVTQAQGTIASGSFTLAAATAATIIGAFAGRRKFRVLNWIQAPVYISYGTTGTPASGAGSDFIPAAQVISGVLTPGQYEPLIMPTGGMRAVCATAGDLTVQAA